MEQIIYQIKCMCNAYEEDEFKFEKNSKQYVYHYFSR